MTAGAEVVEDDAAYRDDAVFKALSDPTRRRILLALATQEMAAGQVAAMFPISGPSVSRHLTVLRSAGLVRERREGNRLVCSLVREPLTASIQRLADGLSAERTARIGKKKPKAGETAQAKKKTKRAKRRGSGGTGTSATPPSGSEAGGLQAMGPTLGAGQERPGAGQERPGAGQERPGGARGVDPPQAFY